MFKCLQEEEKAVDDTRIRPAGSDFKAIEETLKQGLKPSYIQAIEDDNAECLESELKIESRPPSKKISKKKKKNRQAIKEEDMFSNLTKRVFHLACALDAAECCKLLLAPDDFPSVWIDAIEECGSRSALHFACLCHSHKCIEILLKHGANPALKSKHSLIPLEEALLSTRLHVSWDLSTPAAEIVNRVHDLDLTSIKNVEQKCKEQLLPIASKLAKNLNLVPLIALLLTARNSLVTTIIKNLDSNGDSEGTLIDLLVGRVLSFAHTNEEFRTPILHPGDTRELNNFHKKSLCEDVAICRRESLMQTKFELKGGSVTEIMHGRHREEKIFSEHRNVDNDNRDNSCTVNKLKKQGEYVGQMEKNENSFSNDHSNSYDTSEYQLALKVLECVLLCTPRLSGNPQSSYLPPLLRAAQANEEMLISLLLSQAPVNEIDGDGNTALHWSLRQATPTNKRSLNIRIVEKLLKAGASVTLGNKLGATPVHTAAGHGHFEALLTILQKDSTGVNMLAATKETPLHYSVKNNHLICTALLLKYGANRNVMNLKNQKPLHLASSQEMHALLSVDDDTVKELSWQSLIASVTLNAQQWSSDYGTSQNIFLSTSYPQEMDPLMVLPQAPMQTGNEPRNTSNWQFTKSHRPSFLKSSTSAGGDNPDGLQSTLKLPGYKTTFCRFFGTSDGCGWGNKCHFAHSLEEMQFWSSQAFVGLANNHLSVPRNCGTSNLLCPSTGSPATSSVSEDNEEPNKVFVGGLPPFTTPEDLREIFEEEFGIVKNAVIILGSDKEGIVRSRGFGFVSFEHKRDADEAVNRHFLPVQGKKVEVKRATYRPGEEPYKASVPVSGCWPPGPNSVASASQVSFSDDALQPLSPSLSSVGSTQSQWPSNVPLCGTVCGETGKIVAQARENYVGQSDLVRLHNQAALEEESLNNNNDYCAPDWLPFPQNGQQNGSNYADISYPSFFSNYDASACSPASCYVKDGTFIDSTVPNPLSKTSSSFTDRQHISQTKLCTPEDEEREFMDLLALLQVTPSKSQRKSSHQLHHMGISDPHNDCQSHYNQIRSRPFQYDFQQPGLQTNQQYVSPVQWANL